MSRLTSATTMKDIARTLGLSQSTVSRVLSGTPSAVPIAAATRERVMAEARRLGYRPNPLASGLRGASTRLIGVIMGELIGPWGVSAVDAITTAATALGYNTLLGNAHGSAEEAIALRAVLETHRCDAMLLVGHTRNQLQLLEDLRDTAIPLVAWGQGIALPGITTVNVDNVGGARTALEHLAGLGHHRIAFVGIADYPAGDAAERKEAYVTFMRELEASVPDCFVQEVADDPAAGAEAVERLFACREPPTAVFCSTDLLAIGALHGAYRIGKRVPDDVSIVGFDDVPLAAYTVPSLTTLHMPMADMARLAVHQALKEEAGDEDRAAADFRLAPSLVVRQSSGRAPNA